jgi:hypothetical protein
MNKRMLNMAIITILIATACLAVPGLSHASLNIDPPGYDFGEVEVGSSSSATIVISTDTPCRISEVGLDGSEDFEITSVSPGVPTILVPGAALSVEVTYTPGSSGKSSANLLVSYLNFAARTMAEEIESVVLAGEGIADSVEIEIDIKPGSYPNSINLKSKGVVPVAALTSEDFNASAIDPESVVFAGAKPVRWNMEDVDEDGDMDMLFHFKTRELDLEMGDTEATLTGETDAGPVEGTDTVRIVGGSSPAPSSNTRSRLTTWASIK